ncbi:MAG: YncE family protein [Burkholderiales bacterium]
MRPIFIPLLAATAALLAACAPMTPQSAVTPKSSVGERQLMLVANDEKIIWDDAGKAALSPAGRDTLSVVDIGGDPLAPRIVANIALPNTIIGPPTNLAITPDGMLALVANSMNTITEGGALKNVPDNRLFVIDLSANPPKIIDTVTVGKQPSGLSINKAGTLALVANRADGTVSVLRILGKRVEVIDTVSVGTPADHLAHVRFTPDGKRALAAKFGSHKLALLDVEREKVTYNKVDLPTGLWPYNFDVTPDGRLALTADNGNSGAADGHVDTVSVIDLMANPPRVIDKVVVGDAPEGFVVSPTGKMAVAVLLRGSNAAKTASFYHRNGSVVALKIDGDKVTKMNEVEVRGLPEGAVFSEDGKYLYVGNFVDQDVSILKVEAGRLVDTGKTLKLPGHPAAMRGRTLH